MKLFDCFLALPPLRCFGVCSPSNQQRLLKSSEEHDWKPALTYLKRFCGFWSNFFLSACVFFLILLSHISQKFAKLKSQQEEVDENKEDHSLFPQGISTEKWDGQETRKYVRMDSTLRDVIREFDEGLSRVFFSTVLVLFIDDSLQRRKRNALY